MATGSGMTSGDTHQIFEALDTSTYTTIFGVGLNSSSGSYRLRARGKDDAGVYAYGGYVPISNAWHAVEVEWQAASAAGANDGFMRMWIDGALVTTLSGADNDTRAIDEAMLGGVSSLG